MSRLPIVLLLLICCCCTAFATQLCLNGTATLVRSTSAPDAAFCNDEVGCDVRFELSFDSTTMDSGRWPLRVQLADGLYLSSYFPELTDVAFQCDSGGDIIASTLTASGSQRARLIWTYSGASSVSCEYVMETANLQSDFSSFEVLLSYSEDAGAASFDAMFTSTDPAYSITALTVACPVDDTPSPSEAPGSTSGTTGDPVLVPSIGSCRYPLDTWTHARRYAAEWLVVAASTPICGISYKDLAYGRGDARSLPTDFLLLTQQVVAVALNAAMYSVELAQINDTTVLDALDVVSHSINCADTRAYDGLVGQLTLWNDNTASCVGGDVNTDQHVGASSTCSDQRAVYLTWAIVMTVVVGFLIVIILVAVAVMLYRRFGRRFATLAGVNGSILESAEDRFAREDSQQAQSLAQYSSSNIGAETMSSLDSDDSPYSA